MLAEYSQGMCTFATFGSATSAPVEALAAETCSTHTPDCSTEIYVRSLQDVVIITRPEECSPNLRSSLRELLWLSDR